MASTMTDAPPSLKATPEFIISNINAVEPAKLLRIPISFGSYITLGLLDTGSGISIISSKMFDSIKDEKASKRLPLDKIKISTASGDPMSIEGKSNLTFKISAIDKMKHPFYIVKELAEDVILGLDFIAAKGITYKGEDRSFSFMKDGVIRNHTVANIRVQDGFSDEKIGVEVKPNIGYAPGKFRNQIECLIKKYEGLFAKNMSELGRVPGVQHTINNFAMPRRANIYRTPHALRPIMKEHIENMLKNGVIRPSKSSCNAPVMLIPKKTKGEFRFVVNFKDLNSVCTPEFVRVPRIDETIDSLSKSIVYSTIDLFSGYYQIEVAEPSAFLTAFTTEFGHYEWSRMPMGLAGSSSSFIRLMDEVIRGHEGYIKTYIDDVVVHSSSHEEHIIHLEKLFIQLQKFGLKMKMSKCFFGQEEIEYLGHIVSRHGVKPNPSKINDVKCYPIPKKTKQVKGFLGLCGYFRRFVNNFAATAHPLTILTKKTQPWMWGPEQQKAFETLRDNLINYPTLGFPMFDRVFRITSDASLYGIGGTLTQMQPSDIEGVDEEVERVICYTSKHLTENESRWPAVERECYALYHCTKVWNCYLYFREVHCFTDHRPLQWLNNTKPEQGRLFSWAQRLRTYDITIFYKQGIANQAADALSRIGEKMKWYVDPVTVGVNSLYAAKTEISSTIEDWLREQRLDAYCQDALKKMDLFNKKYQEFVSNGNIKANLRGRKKKIKSDKDSGKWSNLIRDKCLESLDPNTVSNTKIHNVRVQKEDSYKTFLIPAIKRVRWADLEDSKEILPGLNKEGLHSTDLVEDKKTGSSESGASDDDACLDVDNKDEPCETIWNEANPFKILTNGLISTNEGRILVPVSLRESVLKRHHNHQLAAHQGVTRTLAKLRARFKWPKMGDYVRKYIAKCLICAKRKCHGTSRAPMKPLPATSYVGQKWAMDISGPIYPVGINGNKYIIVFCEYTTRYVEAAPMADQTAHTVAEKFIEKVVLRHGISSEILTDRGPNFCSNLMENLYKQLGIRHIKTSSYRAQSDGVCENQNKSMGNSLAIFVSDNPSDWERYLDYVIFSYNTSVHASLKESPFYLMYGRDCIEPGDMNEPMRYRLTSSEEGIFSDGWRVAMETARKNLERAQITQKAGYDKRTRPLRFYEIGDEVLIREMACVPGKFNLRFRGPYKITKKMSDHNYLVKNLEFPNRQERVIHVDRIKLWVKNDPNTQSIPETINKKANDENKNKTATNKYNLRPKINLPIRYRQK